MSLDTDIRRLAEAYRLAAEAHAGQRRRGIAQIPYVNHLCDVATLVAGSPSADVAALTAAVLHDVVEDSEEVDLAQIERRFGARIAGVVAELTDDPAWEAMPTAERKARQAGRARDASARARLVKIADQISNARDRVADVEARPDEVARHRAWLDGARAVVDVCRGTDDTLEAAFDRAAGALDRVIRRHEAASDTTPEAKEARP
ncbi:MAG: HD domain-containing protein [Paracoccaceae bacterium]